MNTFTTAREVRIGELARLTGVKIVTIRYYERIGIMPAPARTEGGSRLYDEDLIKRLSFIKRARGLGFGLDEIRAMLGLVDEGAPTCREVHALTTTHLASVREKIADLTRLERVLVEMVAECSRGDIPDCPIIEALFASSEPSPSAGDRDCQKTALSL